LKYKELLDKQSTTYLNTSSISTIDHQLFKNEEDLQNIQEENDQNEGKDSMIEVHEAEDLDNDNQLLGHNYIGDKVCSSYCNL